MNLSKNKNQARNGNKGNEEYLPGNEMEVQRLCINVIRILIQRIILVKTTNYLFVTIQWTSCHDFALHNGYFTIFLLVASVFPFALHNGCIDFSNPLNRSLTSSVY